MGSLVRKVIVLNDFAAVNGGSAQIAISSLYGLAGLVPEVVFLAAVDRPPSDLAERGVQCVLLGQQEILQEPNRSRAIVQGLWNRKAARVLASLLRQSDPAHTVVHLHGWHKALSSSVVRTARKRGFKVVLTLHDYFAACPNGGFYNYPRGHVCPLRGMSPACMVTNCDARNFGHKMYRVCRQFVQNHFGCLPQGLSHFIYYSDTARSHLRDYLPASAMLHWVDNPISIPQGPPADVAVNSKFVFLGRVAREKGARLFAEATRQAGVEAMVIGAGPEEASLRSEYPAIRWKGWQSRETVSKLLGQARCLVFPSVWFETQGLVVREAAALGIPSIVSDVTAAREWVDDNRNGLLFTSNDLDSLHKKITWLKDDDKLAASLGREAYRQYWATATTRSDHSRSLIKVYEAMLDEAR